MNHTERLHYEVSQVCPIIGLSVGTVGDSGTVRIDFAAEATDPQKTDAQAAVDSFDWSDSAHDDWLHEVEKVNAGAAIDGNTRLGYDNRALSKLIVDELNRIAKRIRDMDAAVAAATTLADLKSRWAALSALPDRTLAQAKSAYKSLIDSGVLKE